MPITTYPQTTGTTSVSASYATLPASASEGTLAFTADDGFLYIYNSGTWVPINTPPSTITASRIAISNGAGALIGADTLTYPSLTEFAYVKGVTSGVQTQFDDINTLLADVVYTTGSSMIGQLSWSVQTTAVSANSNFKQVILVTDTSAARTITMQSAEVAFPGTLILIKDASGAAATNNITVDTEGSETIDGAASVVISANYGVIRIVSDGTNWFTV